MSKRDKVLISFLLSFLVSCNLNQSDNIGLNYFNTSKNLIGSEDYLRIYGSASDSINFWAINKFRNYLKFSTTKSFFLDSLICSNSNQDRLVFAILEIDKMDIANSDGITVFYGEKIKSNWYFFEGSYFIIPREMYKDQNIHTPLSYQQLHQAALKNIYNGYLKNGQINEAWFTEHFEGIGWGDFEHQETSDEYLGLKGKRFTNKREFFEAIHLQTVKNNWLQRDTTQAIIPLKPKHLP